MDELLEVLEKEEAEYRLLVETSTRKKEVIIKADIQALEEITGEEQEIAGRIKNMENKRISVMEDMANVLNRKPEELTVDVMIDILQKQPEEQENISNISNNDAAILTTLKIQVQTLIAMKEDLEKQIDVLQSKISTLEGGQISHGRK